MHRFSTMVSIVALTATLLRTTVVLAGTLMLFVPPRAVRAARRRT
jgi:hypothetical protein